MNRKQHFNYFIYVTREEDVGEDGGEDVGEEETGQEGRKKSNFDSTNCFTYNGTYAYQAIIPVFLNYENFTPADMNVNYNLAVSDISYLKLLCLYTNRDAYQYNFICVSTNVNLK